MNQFINESVKKAIGFEEIIQHLSLQSPYGQLYFQSLKPFNHVDELKHEFIILDKLLSNQSLFTKLRSILQNFKNIKGILKQCEKGHILDTFDLYEIKIQSIHMNELAQVINSLKIDAFTILNCDEIIELLSPDSSNITYDFYLYDRYSDDLKAYRNKKREIEQLIYKNESDKLRLHEKRSEYVILEKEEELKVRTKLSQIIKEKVLLLLDNINKIGHLDFALAKALMAINYQGIKPTLTQEKLYFDQIYHPLIKEKVEKKGQNYTHNRIEIPHGTTVLTGANMSGKSSILKTVALNVLLCHLGFYVFAEKAEIPLLSGIEYVGLEIEKPLHGLSSFGLEINAINEVVKNMKTKTCLICVDEFARSTNPSEGQKFVSAFAKFANHFSSYTIMATHYDGVVEEDMNHYQIVGLKEKINPMKVHSIDDINHYMDYTLVKRGTNHLVPKEAYRVSLLLGVDEELLKFIDKCYEE